LATDIDEFSPDAWEQLALATGKVTLHWSAIHGWIEIMFGHFSGMTSEKAEAIFFDIRNDRTQRDMVLKLARHSMEEHPELISELEKLFKKIARQSKKRNKVIHLLWQKVEWHDQDARERLQLIIRSPHDLRRKSWSNDIVRQIIKQFDELSHSLQETERLTYDLWRRIFDQHLDDLMSRRTEIE
jgi:hypothetical protein